jgi:predicted enzyme related to lactoylglutathione lyase
VWHDLLTHDAEAAREFYGDLFGWSFDGSETAPGRYWDITREGEIIGSVFSVDPDEVDSPLWLVSVSVSDVDGAVSRASGLGAAITSRPSDFPNRGRYAVVEDPHGAFLVLLRSTSGDPKDGREIEPGQWLWTELWTTDAPGAVEFYEALLGYRSEGIAGRLQDSAEDEYGETPAEGDLPDGARRGVGCRGAPAPRSRESRRGRDPGRSDRGAVRCAAMAASRGR